MVPEAHSLLTEFVNLVEELNSLRLAQSVLGKQTITVQVQTDWEKARLIDFDEEDCRSFLLGSRLLIQDNERISLRLLPSLLEECGCGEALKDLVEGERFLINLSLDEPCMVAAPRCGSVTNRDVFETFMWGCYAHRCMNPLHRERFLQWQTDTRQFMALKVIFLLMLKIILQAASRIATGIRIELESASNAQSVLGNAEKC